MSQSTPIAQLEDAQKGFDLIFVDNIEGAKEACQSAIQLGRPFNPNRLGIVCFLQAALGLEKDLMLEAATLMDRAEQSSTAALKASKVQPSGTPKGQFSQGLEWEILQANAVVFSGLVHALKESYVGFVRALYALYNANSKFTKLFKTAFPMGLPGTDRSAGATIITPRAKPGIMGLLGGSFSRPNSRPSSTPSSPLPPTIIDDFILAGAAFGYGLFTLAMSLLPPRIRSLIGWFGLQTDRKLALDALNFAATKEDIHSVFAALVLLGYWDLISSLAGWQAEEADMISQFETVLKPLEKRYSEGALWTLYKAKLKIMAHQIDEGAQILRAAVDVERPYAFKQTGALLIFELAWTSFGQREYAQAGDLFVKMTKANNWSHATYLYIAACCYLAIGDSIKAEELYAKVKEQLEETQKSGKELPAEVFVRKRLAFYESKPIKKLPSDSRRVSDSMVMNGAEEIAIFWNVHNRISKSAAEARLREWMSLAPPVACAESPIVLQAEGTTPSNQQLPLENDELALRDLLLGIVHRTVKHFTASRKFLDRAFKKGGKVECTWLTPTAAFEIAVLELQEANAKEKCTKEEWKSVLRSASAWLTKAAALSSNSQDMSTRLEIRIAMLQDEIKTKQSLIEQ